ncbi:DNA polymerase III subunit gamma/tau [Nitrogeniibacter mangrovi]|uniref:DNA polymerase III subunit gamma/tau n=1 Tax=Nitrogeniibacter mangrovi TaxID=2016596 RepID=A0A6C1B6A2_9RHOO|nr:DNA polymerase III subunit gamma/tau [Nitrogeniibacter mangrovi]QID18569.1 DNA polymerase III subunit gamma/tau [Nitrogeniibacter mangrovi]
MSYQVLARKWRPKSFDTLVGQEHVVRALTHALETGRLHHAYLFTGTRGVGKTTIARIMAKALNCETGITPTPCGQCASCQEIDAGRFVDLLEVDAATNTRVDEMRQLLENATYAPTRGRFKVYVIDEVHMLSNSAFNAMLKTLEEPPEHIKFILATTDPQKIPVTVLSRCLQFNLKQMPQGHIVEHLARILEQEGVPTEPAALRHLAKAAAGSMRDALSLLDQAIAHGAGKVEDEAVQAMLGTVGDDHLFALLDALRDENVAAMLETAAAMEARSLSFEAALQSLASLLQRIAVFQFAPEAVTDAFEAERLQPYADAFDPEFLQLAYQIAIHGRDELPLAPDEYAGFTMTLLRLHAFRPDAGGAAGGGGSAAPQPKRAAPAALAVTAPPARTAAPAPKPAPAPPVPVASVPPVAQAVATPAPAPVGDVPPWEDLPPEAMDHGAPSGPLPDEAHEGAMSPPPVATAKPAAVSPVHENPAAPAPAPAPSRAVEGELDWHGLIRELGLKGMVRELAQHCEWGGMADGEIRLTLGEAHKHLMAMATNVDRLQAELNQHFDRPVRLRIEIGRIAGETPAQRDAAIRQVRHAEAVAALEQDPFVQEMIERFDATLQESSVRPL